MARPEKTAAVAEIVESFNDAAGAVLTEYRGESVEPVSVKVAGPGTRVERLTVNGQPARATAANFADWEITLDAGTTRVEAKAEDAAGNVEPTPMVLTVK